jgi:hypothetical protein
MITSAEEFVRLRTSESPDEYYRAAREEASIEVWMTVIKDYPDMREWVAHNKTVPIEILEILARDLDERVRYMVASKRKLTVPLFELLARDVDEGVRERIAYNAKTPKHVLERLSNDEVLMIAEAARKRLSQM